jgi:hypothetical protein
MDVLMLAAWHTSLVRKLLQLSAEGRLMVPGTHKKLGSSSRDNARMP